MRGQPHLRRAGMVSAGTLAIVLTGAATPPAAAAEANDDQKCKDGEGLLSTVTGVVCDTTGTLTDTTKKVVDGTTGGAAKNLTGGVKDTADRAAGGLHDTVTGDSGDGNGGDSPPSTGPGGSSGGGSSGGGSGGGGSGGSGGSGEGSGGENEAPRGRVLGAAGSPAGARGEALATGGGTGGGGTSPHLQPLSPMAGLHPDRSLDSGTGTVPKLPEIAPSPVPSPAPTPPVEDGAQGYAEPASQQQHDRGEASPALMVIFAIIAAGVVTGGHVAVAQARLRSRRVD